jgi:flagella basal body P-ring formation protein FlgA
MRVAALLFLVFAAPAGAHREPDADAPLRQAIVAAVQARMGPDVEVAIDDLRVPAGWPHETVQARLDPGARLGRPMRFALGAPSAGAGGAVAWTGSAEARMRVLVPHLHTRRPVARGETLGEADVALVRHAVDGPLRPWPAAGHAGRIRVVRDLAADACLAPGTISVVPLVQAGQTVQATVRIGGIVAEAGLVAADNGAMGAVIRVVNPQSRRTLKARVTGAGQVEVIND